MASFEDEDANFMATNDVGDDILGLDTAISITKRKPVARLDAARILDEDKGVPYITRNHRRIAKSMRSNDKRLQHKLKNLTFLDAKEVRKLKVDNELGNLAAVLGFYQTWCHHLFPKATFKDCISLLRARGATSSELSHYRKELINAEIQKSKRASGPYVEENDEHSTSNVIVQHEDTENQDTVVLQGSDQPVADDPDDDWMMGAPENGLFVTENTDTTTNSLEKSIDIETNEEVPESTTASDIDDADNFDDELELFMNKSSPLRKGQEEEFPEEGDYQ